MVKNCQEVKFLAIRHTSCSNSYSGTGPLETNMKDVTIHKKGLPHDL